MFVISGRLMLISTWKLPTFEKIQYMFFALRARQNHIFVLLAFSIEKDF